MADLNLITSALGEFFGFLKVMNDPEKRKEMYELHLDKRARKALHAGEQHILALKNYNVAKAEGNEKHMTHWEKKLNYWEKVFFLYN